MTGEEMTAQLLSAMAPIVHDQPSALVLQAICGALMATVSIVAKDEAQAATLLRRFADRARAFAEMYADGRAPVLGTEIDRLVADGLILAPGARRR